MPTGRTKELPKMASLEERVQRLERMFGELLWRDTARDVFDQRLGPGPEAAEELDAQRKSWMERLRTTMPVTEHPYTLHRTYTGSGCALCGAGPELHTMDYWLVNGERQQPQ